MNSFVKWLALSAAVVAAQAQITDQVRRAAISGSRGTSGKCTIEVRVDMTAEVDIYGDSGRLRTLAGQPATWTRFDCTDALPYNMSDFRFSGVDGRGSVRLVQDPRNNNSTAVIRIEDPKGGAEGYTFEIEWSGASGGAPTGGFQTGGPYPSSPGGGVGYGGRGRPMGNFSTERAIDLCRTELRARSERDYGLRNIDVTSAAADNGQNRRNWITGTFNDRSGGFGRRGNNAYRFNCEVDYRSGEVRTLEVIRPDGSPLQTRTTGGVYNSQGTAEQSQALRACQDAVVARTNRDGYQNVNFVSTGIDTRRSDWISGSITATRGPVTDTFDFGCSMDMRAARVRNVDLTRR